MTNNFNASQAKANAAVEAYTYESLLKHILLSAENSSKVKSNFAMVGMKNEDVTNEILDQIESELKSRDFEVLITHDLPKQKTYIKVSW